MTMFHLHYLHRWTTQKSRDHHKLCGSWTLMLPPLKEVGCRLTWLTCVWLGVRNWLTSAANISGVGSLCEHTRGSHLDCYTYISRYSHVSPPNQALLARQADGRPRNNQQEMTCRAPSTTWIANRFWMPRPQVTSVTVNNSISSW